ncbi:hypothetical protein KFL_003740060 [Klebsormidium nitens]|uniref:Uncharacterized protein n=1 Tax=Klebsormidium nitens TaxID=105231 RepID=A0A1Y1I9V3_KLENI|nr:hypothetical protein KFL_003740060 [Klebsormidium nitens]|eukprot:GAQ87745.1 hypothetical protein KFL_003740060 [Klebsormidium nitens]
MESGPLARPGLEPPPGLIRWDTEIFLMTFVHKLSQCLQDNPQQLTRDSSFLQVVKTLVSEQRKLLAITDNLVTWVQELGGLVERVKELGGVFKEAVNEALREVTQMAALGRRVISEQGFRVTADLQLACLDDVLGRIEPVHSYPVRSGGLLSGVWWPRSRLPSMSKTSDALQIPAGVSNLFLPDDYLTLRRLTHSLAFVSVSARILVPLKEPVERIQNAASKPPVCHQRVLALLVEIEAMGGPLAARFRRKLPKDLLQNDISYFLFTGQEYEENMEDAAHDLRSTLQMMLDSVNRLDDPLANSREAEDWDTLAATGAFPGVECIPPPMSLEEQMERMRMIRGEYFEVVPILLYTDKSWERDDGSPVLDGNHLPALLPQGKRDASLGVRYGVAFVSIPIEENLEISFDAMHVTEFWRLDKQQFLELYAAWSDSTDDPGAIFCPGYASKQKQQGKGQSETQRKSETLKFGLGMLLKLFALDSAEQLFLAARLMSGIHSGGPGVVIGWRSKGTLGSASWFSDKEDAYFSGNDLRDLLLDIFQFAPTTKPPNIVAHGLGAAYVTFLLLALPSYGDIQIGTIVVATPEGRAGSLKRRLNAWNHERGRNGDPPIRCVRYVQTHNRPFAFEKLVEFDPRPRDGECLEAVLRSAPVTTSNPQTPPPLPGTRI